MIRELLVWIEAFLSCLPGRIGSGIRMFWYSTRFKGPGRVKMGPGCTIIAPGSIHVLPGVVLIGSRCYFNADGGKITIFNRAAFNIGAHINASVGGSISIGEKCMIGPGVLMRTSNHRHDDIGVPMQDQGHECGDIVLEDDVWIGSNAVILANVRIGRGAIIGAAAVVTKDVPAMAIAMGVPARVVRLRNRDRSELPLK